MRAQHNSDALVYSFTDDIFVQLTNCDYNTITPNGSIAFFFDVNLVTTYEAKIIDFFVS